MNSRFMIGGALGGLALFIWLGMSWGMLPFHRAQLKQLPSDRALAGELQASGTTSGMYYYPIQPERRTAEAMESYNEAFAAGPVIGLLVYRENGKGITPPLMMGMGLLYAVLQGLLAAWLLSRFAGGANYLQRVLSCTVIGLIIALGGPLTFGNFFMFPPAHLFLELLDQLIGWTIAGLVIAAFAGVKARVAAA